MSEASIVVVGLTLVTFVFKGAGAMLARVPESVARRLPGLAPALLAALVTSLALGDDGLPRLDAKFAGVAVAVVLAWRKAPLGVCIVGGALTAAVIRLFS